MPRFVVVCAAPARGARDFFSAVCPRNRAEWRRFYYRQGVALPLTQSEREATSARKRERERAEAKKETENEREGELMPFSCIMHTLANCVICTGARAGARGG